MHACVVAYPELAPADRAWIERLRLRYDPHYRLIAPHWTLIFPTAGLAEGELTQHVGGVAAAVAPFAVDIRCALVVRDSFSPLTHLFLVPDGGFSHLVTLHDALYAGLLAEHLRLDVPYIPHMTIGAFTDPQACKAVADTLNRQPIRLTGRITALSMLAVEPGRVTLRQAIPLMDQSSLAERDD